MLNTPLHLVPLYQIEEILNNEKISCVVRPAGYSNFVAPSYNAATSPKWLVILSGHPVRTVVCAGTSVRFRFIIHLSPEEEVVPISIRRLKLRKLYPHHRVRTATTIFNAQLNILVVEARIPQTEPVITLLDSLRAAERIWDEFKKDE